jgi:hypothetical protein
MRRLSLYTLSSFKDRVLFFSLLWIIIISIVPSIHAQSTTAEFPTPIFTKEIKGLIAPRDIGDARLTRHFYTLGGGPGDLEILVESKNINGDIDLFSASSLRPLTKLSIYDTGGSATLSKSVYLKSEERLILRIEARTSGDEEGTYTIQFNGAFIASKDPVPNNEEEAETTARTEQTAKGDTYKVNAAGARIHEPSPVIPALSQVQVPNEVVETTTAPVEPTTKKENLQALKTDPPRPKRPKPVKPKAQPSRPTTAKSVPTVPVEPTETPADRPTDTPTTSPTTERAEIAKKIEPSQPVPPTASTTPKPATPKPTPPVSKAKKGAAIIVVPQTKLVIEKRDGTIEEHPMKDVRRIIMEKGYLLVVKHNGTSSGYSMFAIVRMAIEP